MLKKRCNDDLLSFDKKKTYFEKKNCMLNMELNIGFLKITALTTVFNICMTLVFKMLNYFKTGNLIFRII